MTGAESDRKTERKRAFADLPGDALLDFLATEAIVDDVANRRYTVADVAEHLLAAPDAPLPKPLLAALAEWLREQHPDVVLKQARRGAPDSPLQAHFGHIRELIDAGLSLIEACRKVQVLFGLAHDPEDIARMYRRHLDGIDPVVRAAQRVGAALASDDGAAIDKATAELRSMLPASDAGTGATGQ